MASQGFTFPPPPPPPPTQQPQPPSQTYGNASSYSQNNFPQHGGYRGGHRGRGRGGMNRGGRGGHANYHTNNTQQGIYGAHSNAPLPSSSGFYHQNAYPAQSYPGYSAQTSTATPAYPHTTYTGSYATATTGPAQSHTQPAVYGPTGAAPMHWPSYYPGSTNGASYTPGYPKANHYNKGGQKRGFSSAFEKPTTQPPRVAAPPAVPSFGVPLPAKPPKPTDSPRKAPKKKKRKTNQLGLTPKTEEHESSAEEDDADEESRLAGAQSGGSVQVTFRGQTSVLNTTADIQAWIAERRKRFPTQARVEEKKKAEEEARKEKERQREEARSKKEVELREQQAKASRKDETMSSPADAVLKAKAKADKLRKKLMKEEKRLQKAEADAERARQQQQPPPSQTEESSSSTLPIPLPAQKTVETGEGSLSSILDVDSASSSEDSDDSEDDNDDDGAPEEMTSRRQAPDRVAPPAREGSTKNSRPCRDFLRKGKCPRGARCRFSHEPRAKARQQQPSQPATARRGLYQMLVAQETQSRDRQAMQAISWLGSQGLLDAVDGATATVS